MKDSDVPASPTMRVGIQLPLFDYAGTGLLNGRDIRSFVEECGRMGVREFSASDHIHYRSHWFDGLIGLSYAAALVPGARIATTACLPTLRGPAVTAKSLVSLGRLADRGLLGGISQGSSNADYKLVGVPLTERRSRFVDASKFLRAALDGERTFDGQYYRLEEPLLPAADSNIELWLATWGGPKALELAVEVGDGLFLSGAGSSSIADMRTICDRVRSVERQGRRPFGLGISTCFFSVTETTQKGQQALEELSTFLKGYPALLADTLVVGTVDRCAAQLARYAELGIEILYLLPVGDYYGHVTALSNTILPALQSQGIRASF